jgi:hypothetical protein
MNSLASSFPLNVRQKYAQKSIKPRSVIKLFSNDTNPPKNKLFIIIGQNENQIGSLIVNSEINQKVHPVGSYFYSLQKQLDYFPTCQYLKHTSYADCTFIHEWKIEEITTILTNIPERILGTLCEDHWRIIIDTILTSKHISVKKKKKFGLYSFQ